MLPIDRVFVQPLDAHRQLATVGSDMRHHSLAMKILAHALVNLRTTVVLINAECP